MRPAQLQQGGVYVCQGLSQLFMAFAHSLFCREKGAFGDGGGIHVPRAVRQVVRLVYQENMPALCAVKKTLQAHHRVEQVVVIADDAVAEEREVQRELERAQGLGLAEGRDGFAREVAVRV